MYKTEFEPLTVEEREREPGMPVGLKNIGNTCYFNSYIQMLYFLPGFARKLLRINPDDVDLDDISNAPSTSRKKLKSSVQLVLTLRKLFAFLTKSEKKYVNPGQVIRIIHNMGNQLKIGDEEDIGEVSEGLMSTINEGYSWIMNQD